MADVLALVHRTCGHAGAVAGAGNCGRKLLERKQRDAASVGHFGWRVRIATDQHLTDVLTGNRCATCWMGAPEDLADHRIDVVALPLAAADEGGRDGD